jgi:hypothetical protein
MFLKLFGWSIMLGNILRENRLAMLEGKQFLARCSLPPQNILKYRVSIVTELIGVLFSP